MMIDLSNVKVRDKLTRVIEGFRPDQYWRNEAVVSSITDNEICCVVWVDVPRTMYFDRVTGINVMGRDYGWLEESEAR